LNKIGGVEIWNKKDFKLQIFVPFFKSAKDVWTKIWRGWDSEQYLIYSVPFSKSAKFKAE